MSATDTDRYQLVRSLEQVSAAKAACYFLRLAGQDAVVDRIVTEDHAEALESLPRHPAPEMSNRNNWGYTV